jgi:hypothetical protein
MTYFKFLHANKLNKLNNYFKLNKRNLIKDPRVVQKTFNEIPGPKVYPIVGNLFQTSDFGNK